MSAPSLLLYRALVTAALPVVMPTLAVADRLRGKQRPHLSARWARQLPEVAPGGIWMQSVSVGEVEIGRRVLQALRQRRPECPVLMTATTATGLSRARATVRDWPVAVCPLDLPGPVRRVLEAAQPRLVGLVETELWPEILHQAGRAQVPVVVVNGRLSERSYRRYRRVRRLLQPLLAPVRAVLVRGDADAERFAALGVASERIEVVGNIKYDLESELEPLDWGEHAASDRPVLVAGSTMEGEERAILTAWQQLPERPRLVLAPRHPERFDRVAALLEQMPVTSVRRTALTDGEQLAGKDVILLDTIGELARAYASATVAFLGGSLAGTGGHNPLEASVWGVPVLSGVGVFNFQEVYDELVAAGGAQLVGDGDELASALSSLLANPQRAHDMGQSGRAVVLANRGAVERTVDRLVQLLEGGG